MKKDCNSEERLSFLEKRECRSLLDTNKAIKVVNNNNRLKTHTDGLLQSQRAVPTWSELWKKYTATKEYWLLQYTVYHTSILVVRCSTHYHRDLFSVDLKFNFFLDSKHTPCKAYTGRL